MRKKTIKRALIAIPTATYAGACALCALGVVAALIALDAPKRPRPPHIRLSREIPRSFLSIANYSPNQTAYPGDLVRFNTRWWLAGVQLSDYANQSSMLRHGFHFLPSFNTGYVMRANGLTNVPQSTTKRADPHSCINIVCGLSDRAILNEVQRVQQFLGDKGNYYSIGNEVDDYYSDDVSPGVFVGQFDAWMNAIKQGDPSAKIVAPSISSVSCCQTTSTQPFGTAGQWFQTFVTDYEQVHGGARPPIDVLAMHLYNYDPGSAQIIAAQADNYLSEVQKFRREANRMGYGGTPIWITEIGFEYPPGGPLSSAHRAQVTRVLTELANAASSLVLKRLFLFADNQRSTIKDGLRPLYDSAAASDFTRRMPLTDYGLLVATLASRGRARLSTR